MEVPPGQQSVDLAAQSVTAPDLERELAMLRAAAAGRPGGVFGPGSMVWRIDREAAVFLGAGRALLLQLAHPWVAAAIAEHSRTLADPIGRFHRTFGVVFTMVFGTTEAAVAAARRLHRRHAAIGGVLGETVGAHPAGSPYRANDVAALRWVFATLVDSAVVAFELVNPPLSAAERDTYYAGSRLFAGFFGIPQAALPPNWPAFTHYFENMLASDQLAVGGTARAIAAELFAGAASGWRIPRWYRGLTAQTLPGKLRREFGLNDRDEERAARRALAVIRFCYPHLPARLRWVAPYHEVCRRLAGRRPDRVTRLMNRLWIGRDSMAG